MNGWGATWNKRSFSYIKSLFLRKMEISFFGKIQAKSLSRGSGRLKSSFEKNTKAKYVEKYSLQHGSNGIINL
jgi:hypothetical protein